MSNTIQFEHRGTQIYKTVGTNPLVRDYSLTLPPNPDSRLFTNGRTSCEKLYRAWFLMTPYVRNVQVCGDDVRVVVVNADGWELAEPRILALLRQPAAVAA